MTRSEIARRKRQMNRRIRELVAIRRATMSFAASTGAPVATVAVAGAAIARPVSQPVQAAQVAPVAIRERVNTRTLLFPQIAPPRQLKASAPRSPLRATKAPLPPVCP